MASFNTYAPKLQEYEGGFVNHPSDKGGPTMNGVTLATFRQFYGIHKTVADLRAMTREQWQYIMKCGYWDKVKADQIENQSLAELCADFLINSGVGMIKKIQAAVGTGADGIVGPKTIAALNKCPMCAYNAIMEARKQHYADIVRRDPGQKIFLTGWMNRLGKMRFVI